MLRFTALLTVVAWTPALLWSVWALTGSSGGSALDVGLLLFIVLLSCSATTLALITVRGKSLRAARAVFILSIVAGLVSALAAWELISPVIIDGVGFLREWTLIGKLWFTACLIIFCLPWLWGIVCHQMRVARDLTNR